jgi:tetratricopeptide (TPR) repeat protein
MHNKKWIPLLMIAALLAAIFWQSARLYSGYSEITNAEAEYAVQDYASATESFEQAASLLFWRDDLWEKAGMSASAAGNSPQAIIFLNRASQLSEQGWGTLALSYVNTGDIPSALKTYQDGLQVHDSASLYAGLAYIYRQQKDWEAESDALKQQIRLDANDAYAHYRLGLLLSFLDPEQALSELMLAASLNPETDPAVQTLRTALNISAIQTDPSQKFVTIGRTLGLVQEWELSMAAFEKAISFNAENAEAWAWLGEAKQQTGQDGRAELDRAIRLDHTSVIARALRGLYWNRQEKYDQMLAEYLLAAEYEPENPAWQASIGDAHYKRGNLIDAIEAYQYATELAPNDATYWRLLAVFCADNSVHVEEIGLPAAQKAFELAPNDPFVLDALGWSYLSSGRYTNAEQTLLDVVARFPSHLPARIHLAMTYLAQGNKSAALTELTYVHDVDGDGPNGLFAKQLIEQYFP